MSEAWPKTAACCTLLGAALLGGCQAQATRNVPPPSAVASNASATDEPTEASYVQALREVHQSPRYVAALLAAGLLAEDVEWWAAGDSTRLPWAGTRRGSEGIQEFSRMLGAHMRYTSFAMREYVVGQDRVAVVIDAAGVARATGRPFASPVVRVYDFRDGRIVRIRSLYDTEAYRRAMDPMAEMQPGRAVMVRIQGAEAASAPSPASGGYLLQSRDDSSLVRFDLFPSDVEARGTGSQAYRLVSHARGRALRPTHAVFAEWKVDTPGSARSFEQSRRELFALRAEHLASFHADFLLQSLEDTTRYLVLGLYEGEEGLQLARRDARIRAYSERNPPSRFGARELRGVREFVLRSR